MHAILTQLVVAAQTVAAQPTTVPAAPVAANPSFGDAVVASLTGAFALLFTIIPRLLGFFVILAVGWLLATALARGTGALLHALRFDEISRRTGLAEFIEQMNSDATASGLVAGAVKWVVRVAVVLVALSALGLPAVGDVLRQFVLWIPNLVVALAVLVLGGLAARAVGNVVRGATAEAGFDNPDTLARVARVVVWAFAIVVAVNQIGIASALVNTLFMGVVGALALATGLAFGLGGRDLAARTLESWNGRVQRARPKMERAAQSAAERTRAGADEVRRVAADANRDVPGYREPRAD